MKHTYCRMNRVRRRAKKLGIEIQIERVLTQAVINKTNGYCYLCWEDIDLGLEYPNKMSLSIEHKIPIVSGGDHVYANLWPSHLDCNRRKGVK